LIFENTPLKEVVDILNARFNVEITASEKEIYSCNFTSTFHQASLREILNVLALSLDLKYTQQSNKYILTGTGCY
jgi:ferric-dicitrate binding protein FerR (iron transport regulator)